MSFRVAVGCFETSMFGGGSVMYCPVSDSSPQVTHREEVNLMNGDAVLSCVEAATKCECASDVFCC